MPDPNSYTPADWFWRVTGRTDVYASARFGYFPLTDAAYLAFLAAGGIATVIDTEANLRDVLNAADVAFQAEGLPALLVSRPRITNARVRLVKTGFSLASGATGAAALIPWTATGAIDPLGMNNAGGANPDRIVIPAGQGGYYWATIAASFPVNATGDRGIQMRRNAAAIPRATLRVKAAAGDTTELFGSRLVQLDAGDIFRVAAAQDSGSTLSIDAEVHLARAE